MRRRFSFLLAAAREAALQERFTLGAAAFVNLFVGNEKLRTGDLDGAIELLRPDSSRRDTPPPKCSFSVRQPPRWYRRCCAGAAPRTFPEAHEAIDRLAAVPTEPRFRAERSLAAANAGVRRHEARGDELAYQDCVPATAIE